MPFNPSVIKKNVVSTVLTTNAVGHKLKFSDHTLLLYKHEIPKRDVKIDVIKLV